MKRAVSISLDPSVHDEDHVVRLGGERIAISRRGLDGDPRRVRPLLADLDGQVQALSFGSGLSIQVDDRTYPLRAGHQLFRGVRKTPVVDGSGLKATLERRVFELSRPLLGTTRFRRGLVTIGSGRWGLATAVDEVTDSVIFGDLCFTVGIPLPIYSLERLRQLATVVLPIVRGLPMSMIYSTTPETVRPPARARALWEGVDLVAGEVQHLMAHLPEDLSGCTVVTNTATEEQIEQFRSRGATRLVTTTPSLDGVTFDTHMLEALLTAWAGHGRPLTNPELDRIIDGLELRPATTLLNP